MPTEEASHGEQSKQKQQVLPFTECPSDGITSITNSSYDHAKVRELASHMVLVHEYPFYDEHQLVSKKFWKQLFFFFKRISERPVKKTAFVIYKMEKQTKLNEFLKGPFGIISTTIFWNFISNRIKNTFF